MELEEQTEGVEDTTEEERDTSFMRTDRDFTKEVPIMHTIHQPWHRQKKESWQAFEAFMSYLVMGQDRSLQKVADQLGKSKVLMARWSRMWHWVHRVACYEEHYMLLQLESVEAQRDQMYAKHALLSSMATDLIEARLKKLYEDIEDGKLDEEALKNDSLIRLFAESTKIEVRSIEARIAGATEIAERRAKIEEEYGEQLADKIQEILNELGIDPVKAQAVIRKHILT